MKILGTMNASDQEVCKGKKPYQGYLVWLRSQAEKVWNFVEASCKREAVNLVNCWVSISSQ